MITGWDVAAYDQDHHLVLAVEVKSKLHVSPEWAARLRRNILAHGAFPNPPYFLMVFPDRFYLWTNPGKNSKPGKPTRSIDARPILRPYFKQSGVTADHVSEASLELITAAWLNDLIHRKPNEIDASQRWLLDSGLYDAVAGGSLQHQVLV